MQEFIIDSMGVDIYNDKYNIKGDSKANRLRAFWEIESNYNVAMLLEKLLEYWLIPYNTGEREYYYEDEALHKECLKIVERLKSGGAVENLDSIKPNSNDESFQKLAASVRQCIYNNEPEVGLDRLHTFVIKFIRSFCLKHQLQFDKETPLHSLFGMYVKHLDSSGLIESDMTLKILKSSISILDSFNKVRNDKSLAHDNSILNYHESLLIFNNISNLIRFIDAIENMHTQNKSMESTNDDTDFPF
jgi:hypothetical protein